MCMSILDDGVIFRRTPCLCNEMPFKENLLIHSGLLFDLNVHCTQQNAIKNCTIM